MARSMDELRRASSQTTRRTTKRRRKRQNLERIAAAERTDRQVARQVARDRGRRQPSPGMSGDILRFAKPPKGASPARRRQARNVQRGTRVREQRALANLLASRGPAGPPTPSVREQRRAILNLRGPLLREDPRDRAAAAQRAVAIATSPARLREARKEELSKAHEKAKPKGALGFITSTINPAEARMLRSLPKGEREAAERRAQQRVAADIIKAGGEELDVAKALRVLPKDRQSPALFVLEQFTRPSSAVAGGVIDASRGKDPLSGAAKGFVKNNRSFREVTGKSTRGKILGTIGDIALDPLTYLTLGTGRPAMEAARRAGTAAQTAARLKGLSPTDIEAARVKAIRETFEANKRTQARGVRVGARGTPVQVASLLRQLPRARPLSSTERAARVASAGEGRRAPFRAAAKTGARLRSTRLGQASAASTREIRTSGRMTSATAGRLVALSRQKTVKPGSGADKALHSLIHSYRPAGMDPATWEIVRNATRKYRATMGTARRLEEAIFESYRGRMKKLKIPEERFDDIRHAVETRKLSELPDAEREVAEAMQRDLAAMHRAKVEAGALAPDEMIRDRRFEAPERVADVKASRQELGRERRGVKRLEREIDLAKQQVARAQGRAAVLSRNVSGRRGESAAEAKRAPKYAGGAVGVTNARRHLAQLEKRHEEAVKRLDDVAARHAEVKAAAAGERSLGKLAAKREAEAIGYVPRILKLRDDDLGDAVRLEPGGQRQTSTSLHRREERMPMRDAPAVYREKFENDLPTIMGVATGETMRIKALGELNNTLVGLGRRVDDPEAIDMRLSPDPATAATEAQRFYIRGPRGDLRPVWRTIDSPSQTLEAARRAVMRGEEVIEVPRELIVSAWQLAKRGRRPSRAGKADVISPAWDEAQRVWKWWATQPNPGYHVRNLIGDAWNARLGGATAGDVATAMKLITARHQIDGYTRDISRGIAEPLDGKTVARGGQIRSYGKNGDLTDAEILLAAESTGAIRLAFTGHELRASRKGERGKHRGTVRRNLEMVSESREDIMRLASFVRALKRGDDFDTAAAYANKHHFDYSDLTDFEVNVLRRLIPFYTFMGRNTPLQVAALIQSPGRFANLEKVRDATAEIQGLPEDWAEAMPEYIQVSVPLVMPGGPFSRQNNMPMGVTPMLPVTDLNSIQPKMLGARLGQSLTPFVKLPIEMWQKYDFFYRDKIRSDLVPAPKIAESPHYQALVKQMVTPIATVLGQGEPTFAKIRDRRTGKMVQGWPWWMDKLTRQIPLTGVIAGATTEGREKRPGDRMTTVTNYATGIRRFIPDPVEGQSAALYKELDKLEPALVTAGKRRTLPPGSPARGKLKEMRDERAVIQELLRDTTSGFANPYFAKPKKKGRRRKSSGFGGGGFGGTFR